MDKNLHQTVVISKRKNVVCPIYTIGYLARAEWMLNIHYKTVGIMSQVRLDNLSLFQCFVVDSANWG